LSQFLDQRAELDKVKDEDKLTWMAEQGALILALETLQGEERVALEIAINEKIKQTDKELKDAQEELNRKKLQNEATFFKRIEDLAALGAEKSIGLLVIEKAAASAQAAINSYLAFTSALKTVPFPFNYAAAAGVLASGLAQQAKIISTSIPSAETGGRFIVPRSIGSDNTLMRVNSDEEVEVTPRGMSGSSKAQNIVVQIEKDTIFSVVNDGIRSGDILIAATNY
jgi:hypothetical protein